MLGELAGMPSPGPRMTEVKGERLRLVLAFREEGGWPRRSGKATVVMRGGGPPVLFASME